ncbi:MAG: hypothetical protein ABIN57_05235 [Chitinophagaceae bacterium]
MRYVKGLAVVTCIVLCISCFFPWAGIPSKNLMITGVNTTGTSFGKPGYLHLFFAGLFLLFLLINRIGAYRANIFIAGFNMGWALRNYILITACEGGECPQKYGALYLVVLSSVALLTLSFFGGKLKVVPSQKD